MTPAFGLGLVVLWAAITLVMVCAWTCVAYWSSPEEQAAREREEARRRTQEWASRRSLVRS